MYVIKNTGGGEYITKRDGQFVWGTKPDATTFATIDDAAQLVRSFAGEVLDEEREPDFAIIAMAATAQQMKLYSIVPLKQAAA